MTNKKICVVGGGPSGLTATKTLIAAGHDVDCFEMSPHIGGHWVLDNPNGRSAAYRSLTTNTTKNMSRFSDFEMPEDWPTFPSHERMREWLESYVDHFGFREIIHADTEVLNCTPVDDGGWTVTHRKNGQEEVITADYDAVVAASGSYWDYQIPNWPGQFDGTIIHAQDYTDTETPYAVKDSNVIVVGIGNTGCELSCEISKAGAASVHLSTRGGTWIMPRHVNGRPASDNVPMAHPTAPVPKLMRLLPEAFRDRLFLYMTRKAINKAYTPRMKRFEELGFPPAPDNPIIKRPTISDDILGFIESGAIKAMPSIQRLDGKNVVFNNGKIVKADYILCATGYRLSYPYIDQSIIDTSDDDLNLFCGIIPPDRDNLFFVGVSRPLGSFWPVAEAQSQFVGELLAGRYKLPNKRKVASRAGPALKRVAVSPGLYALSLREELKRGRA